MTLDELVSKINDLYTEHDDEWHSSSDEMAKLLTRFSHDRYDAGHDAGFDDGYNAAQWEPRG